MNRGRVAGFVTGVLTTIIISFLSTAALAASGQVSFNMSAIQFNGTQISAKGENYTLSNGMKVPASITYTDESGGGTTYLPSRRIAELIGVEVGYDSSTGSVTIGSNNSNGTIAERILIDGYDKYPDVPKFEAYYEYEASASGLIMELSSKNLYYYWSAIAKSNGEQYQKDTILKYGYTLTKNSTTTFNDADNQPVIIKDYVNDGSRLVSTASFQGSSNGVFILKIGSTITLDDIAYCNSHIKVKNIDVVVSGKIVTPNILVSIAMGAVKENLKYPDEAVFQDTITISKIGDDIVVSGKVQAKNGFGVRSTYSFTATYKNGTLSSGITVKISE